MFKYIGTGLWLLCFISAAYAQEDDKEVEETDESKRPSWSAGLPERQKSAGLTKPAFKPERDNDIELDMSEFGLQQESEIELELPFNSGLAGMPVANPNNETQEPEVEPASTEKAALEQAALNQAAIDQAAIDQAAIEQAAIEQAAIEQAAIEQAAIEQAAIEQAAIEQAAREQAAIEQAAIEQAAREQAAIEQAAIEQAAREQAAIEQAAIEQAAREQAAIEQAAIEQAAREQAAIEQAIIEQAAREQAAIEQAVIEQAAREQAVIEQAVIQQAARDQAVIGAQSAPQPITNADVAVNDLITPRENSVTENVTSAPATEVVVKDSAQAGQEIITLPEERSIASVEPPLNNEPTDLIEAASEQVEYNWNILKRAPVDYPIKAAIANLEGWVEVEITINPAGKVVSVSPKDYSRRGRVFGKPAVQSVKDWIFEPPSRMGFTSNLTRIYRVEFKL